MTQEMPTDEIMRAMAKASLSHATEMLAKRADQFALEMRTGQIPTVNGADALTAFANAIRSNNEKRQPPMGSA